MIPLRAMFAKSVVSPSWFVLTSARQHRLTVPHLDPTQDVLVLRLERIADEVVCPSLCRVVLQENYRLGPTEPTARVPPHTYCESSVPSPDILACANSMMSMFPDSKETQLLHNRRRGPWRKGTHVQHPDWT